MNLIVCIIVYDRIDNIDRWLKCWEQCEKHDAELIILHNFYGDLELQKKFKSLCDRYSVTYLPRNGEGYDVGAFRDVCKDDLKDFPGDWTHLLWCCDDCFPMSKDFLKPFIDTILQNGTAVACMEISPYVRKHIRTTGFMIIREAAEKLSFPTPLKTKQDCYLFEHRSPDKTFLAQILKMNYQAVQVENNTKSPLWDEGYHRRLPRMGEHLNAFGIRRKVTFICPVFDAFPEIISSLICQTHKDWELLLIHDGTNNMGAILRGFNDPRIKYIKRPRAEKWGHPLRQWALQEIKAGRLAADAQFICITNADNYHVPTYCQYMLNGFESNPATVATYCKQMGHSYIAWGVINCSLKLGFIDCAGVMVKKNVAAEIGWRDVDSHSADFTYFSDIIQKYGKESFVPVPGCLLIHN